MIKNIRDSILPITILLVIASVLVPLPSTVLDCLIISNFLLAIGLVVLTLQLTDSLQLSALPTILLLSTLFRLCLNISSTRMILTHGTGGSVIEAFGSFVLGGSIGVGCIIFAMLTIIQFIVVAKGSERVAEVAARFTLDALPGKQMAIDADVRAGLYDMQIARQKRQDLQIESRFFGALDGAMKFVKGDAIAGIIIVVINGIGGIVFGLVSGLTLLESLAQYSVLTVGDGISSQIPSLLNSISAGLVVTRVSGGRGSTLSSDLLEQLFTSSSLLKVGAMVVSLLALLPGFPTIPLFIVAGGIFCGAKCVTKKLVCAQSTTTEVQGFRPATISILSVRTTASAKADLDTVRIALEEARRIIFEDTGLLMGSIPIETELKGTLDATARLYLRGVCVVPIPLTNVLSIESIANAIVEFCNTNRTELIDDTMTRRLLDWYEPQFPELVANTVPHILSLTQLSEILRGLAIEEIPLKPFDVLLQAISELLAKQLCVRSIGEEIRISLKRYICAELHGRRARRVTNLSTSDGRMFVALLDAQYESLGWNEEIIPIAVITDIKTQLDARIGDIDALLVNRSSRKTISEWLRAMDLSIPVITQAEILAHLEIVPVFTISSRINLLDSSKYEDKICNKNSHLPTL